MSDDAPLSDAVLPLGVRARFVDGVNGLRMHMLEAGYDPPDRPVLLLLHGFPELAYSWRKVMPQLAAAGYHVIAPDQRGYGRTTGWDAGYDVDLAAFRPFNLVRDALGLVFALGHRSVACVVGHDYGSSIAAWCALLRPDVFRSVVLMSAPFGGPPPLPFAFADRPPADAAIDIDADLAALRPPRRHYHHYYSSRAANGDMHNPPQGLHAFLRGYYHHKSADWAGNAPHPLAAWNAAELATLPTYYVMNRQQTMAETVAAEMPSAAEVAACAWLPDDELAVYTADYARTGFQGGLNWYRCRFEPRLVAELQIFSGRSIDVPSCFISGKSDWGVYQRPGDVEAMQAHVCTRFRGMHLVAGAGHWVQQEQPVEVTRLLLQFIQGTDSV